MKLNYKERSPPTGVQTAIDKPSSKRGGVPVRHGHFFVKEPVAAIGGCQMPVMVARQLVSATELSQPKASSTCGREQLPGSRPGAECCPPHRFTTGRATCGQSSFSRLASADGQGMVEQNKVPYMSTNKA